MNGGTTLSVEKFPPAGGFYDIPSARLMAQISRRAEGRPPIVVDVRTAHTIGGVEGAVLAGFVHEVIALRRQPAPEESHSEMATSKCSRRRRDVERSSSWRQLSRPSPTMTTASCAPRNATVSSSHPRGASRAATPAAPRPARCRADPAELAARRGPKGAAPEPVMSASIRNSPFTLVSTGADVDEAAGSPFGRQRERVNGVVDEDVVARLVAVPEDRRHLPRASWPRRSRSRPPRRGGPGAARTRSPGRAPCTSMPR